MTNIAPEAAKAFAVEVLCGAGVPRTEAEIVAENLLDADLRGVRSHGLMRLATYVERIRRGLCRATADVKLLQEGPATALLDGSGSLGQVVAWEAMQTAMRKAREAGVGIAVARGSNHFGTASFYALHAARSGMVGIAASNTAPLMPAPGGAERVIGNNPVAIAAPSAGEYPVVLDMAMSQVAMGKILNARDKGQSIPADWATDKHGTPTTDPNEAIGGGFLLPAGGPKGYGLAVLFEILTGVLAGGDFAKAIPSMYDMSRQQEISHVMIAIDVASFMPAPLFAERVAELGRQIKGSARAPGVGEVFLPGEIELRKGTESVGAGIAYDDRLITELNGLARTLNLRASIG